MGTPLRHEPSRIRIKNLRLRTFVGFNDEEQNKRQDVIINIAIDYNAISAAQNDNVDQALDYRRITKRVIAHVEEHRFLLLETLVLDILAIALESSIALRAEVEVDKPHALRFSDSVSLTLAASRQDASPA